MHRFCNHAMAFEEVNVSVSNRHLGHKRRQHDNSLTDGLLGPKLSAVSLSEVTAVILVSGSE